MATTFDDALRPIIANMVREEVERALKAAQVTPAPTEPEFMNDRQVAAWIGMSAQTFRQYRCDGEGPTYATIGRAVRYHRPDVLKWVEARKVGRGRQVKSR